MSVYSINIGFNFELNLEIYITLFVLVLLLWRFYQIGHLLPFVCVVHTFPCALGCESYHTEGSAITGEAGCTAGPWLRGWPAASCATASSTRFCPALSGESSSPPGSAALTSRLLRQRYTHTQEVKHRSPNKGWPNLVQRDSIRLLMEYYVKLKWRFLCVFTQFFLY